MQTNPPTWADPMAHLARTVPDHPVLYLSPRVLQDTARRFTRGFPGLVTYAVKANARPEVLANLAAAGLRAFDVASPAEMAAVRAVRADAVLHYHNPVRSEAEIASATALGVDSWSVDDAGELEKLAALPPGAEIAVRFVLPETGASYCFGEKFGATPEQAEALLARVAAMGHRPALYFHPGTQCDDPGSWARYIAAAGRIAARAGVPVARLNVGGGFASNRDGRAPDLEAVFAAIGRATRDAFGPDVPPLVCEPGRAMVAEAFTLAARIKGMRDGGRRVYLNDGIYGGLAEMRDMAHTRPVRVIAPDGRARTGAPLPRTVFGPTCDSIDRLPGAVPLPGDAAPGDYVLFDGMGAYSAALATGFNGYGLGEVLTVDSLSGHPV